MSKCYKLTLRFGLFLSFCFCSSNVYAQGSGALVGRSWMYSWDKYPVDTPVVQKTGYLKFRLSLNMSDVRLDAVLDRITKLTGVKFSYANGSVPVDKKLSVHMEDVTLADAMNNICSRFGLGWVPMKDNSVVIAEKNDGSKGSGAIAGRVADASTGEVLPGATVFLKGTNLGAATDLNGNFIINDVPAGEQTLTVSYIGYREKSTKVNVMANHTVHKDIVLEATAVTGKAVVVTAQAQGQLGAINQQLSSNTIEHVVSAARLQQLPDQNAAESIGRLPGVAIQRYNGEATEVEIRGLSPKYSIITVDGVRIPGTGATDRSVDLSLVPTNMLNGITLKDVVTPDMNADVLGGTVNLKLKQAPSGFHINVSGQGGYDALQKYYGNYNFEGSASNRFLNNKLGAILSLHTDNYNRSADKLQDNYWHTIYQGVQTPITQDLLLRQETVYQKRNGASLLMDYELPNGKITANGFVNQENWTGKYNINDLWTPAAEYNSDRHFYQLEQTGGITTLFTSAIGVKQSFQWIKYDATLAESGTHNVTPNDRVWEFDQEAGAFAGGISPNTPLQEIPRLASIDTNGTALSQVYTYGQDIMDHQVAAKANISLPFRMGDELSGFLKGGAAFRWVTRVNRQSQFGYNNLQYSSGGPDPQLNVISQAYSKIWGVNVDSLVKRYGHLPITPFLSNYSDPNFLNGQYPLGFTLNPTMMNQITNALMNTPYWVSYAIGSLGQNYDGREAYQAGYIMAEIDLGRYLTFIPGVRWEGEHTVYHGESYIETQNQSGVEGPPSNLTYNTSIRNNSFWLPDFNLILRPTTWFQAKLARTETIARPDYVQYAPISNVSSNFQTINAANSELKTSHSTNYDAGISFFNKTLGLLNGDFFYKKIDNLIFYANFVAAKGVALPAGLNIPESWYNGSAPTVNTYMNNPNPADYYGFSLEWQTNFWYLPSVLHGLVLDVNFTHIYSHTTFAYDSLDEKQVYNPQFGYFTNVDTLLQRSISTRMPDQPDFLFNLTIGYDLGGFSARLSYLLQTNQLNGIGYAGTIPTPLLSTYVGTYARWDLALRQKLTDDLQLFADLNNLNNEPNRNYVGQALVDPSYIEYYGFTADLGFRYSL